MTANAVKQYPAAPENLNIAKIREAIPRELFKQNTLKSTAYMLRDMLQVAVTHWLMSTYGAPALDAFTRTLPAAAAVVVSTLAWCAYWIVQGSNFTALWVIAHEAGHGAFSPSATINELVGYVLHTALLVPYHSWRVSHATHHKYTNHLTLDTVFVPKGLPEPLRESIAEAPITAFLQFWGMIIFGWPFHLTINVAGQTEGVFKGKRVNHFEPSSPLFKKSDRWGVIVSDIGLVAVCALIAVAVKQAGAWNVFAYYGVPYLITNGWLVYITFMHHHDVRIPHYTDENFNFVRGALCSVDRDYGVFNTWLHHINDSHVVHHLFHDMPWYNAIEVTRKYIKPVLGKHYASDNRPVLTQTIESWTKCQYVVPKEGITYFRH